MPPDELVWHQHIMFGLMPRPLRIQVFDRLLRQLGKVLFHVRYAGLDAAGNESVFIGDQRHFPGNADLACLLGEKKFRAARFAIGNQPGESSEIQLAEGGMPASQR